MNEMEKDWGFEEVKTLRQVVHEKLSERNRLAQVCDAYALIKLGKIFSYSQFSSRTYIRLLFFNWMHNCHQYFIEGY